MLVKILSLFTLLTYLNTITYHDNGDMRQSSDLGLESETLIEFLLEDIFELPMSGNSEDPDVQYDEYRYGHVTGVMPPFKWRESSLLSPVPLVIILDNTTTLFDSKTICQPGYYTYLFRLKPF